MKHGENSKANLKREMSAIITVLFVSLAITFGIDSLTGLFESGIARWIRVLTPGIYRISRGFGNLLFGRPFY